MNNSITTKNVCEITLEPQHTTINNPLIQSLCLSWLRCRNKSEEYVEKEYCNAGISLT